MSWLSDSFLWFALLTGCAAGTEEEALSLTSCNGSEANCKRRYDQVTFVATHNAFSYANGGTVEYLFPNQDFPISKQLEVGVRGLGIRPCPYYGADPTQFSKVYVTHNFSLRGTLGMEPLIDILTEIRTFLENHPTEVVTLFVESAVSPQQLADVFSEAGLAQYLYIHDSQKGWPTLATMAQINQRLVVFNDSQDAGRPRWQHYLWDLVVDTDYNITDISQFNCDFYRGKPQNSIYLLNNFVYLPLSGEVVIPDRIRSQRANAPAFVFSRAQSCWQTTQRIPNFIYVDWVFQGDVIAAMRKLNDLPR